MTTELFAVQYAGTGDKVTWYTSIHVVFSVPKYTTILDYYTRLWHTVQLLHSLMCIIDRFILFLFFFAKKMCEYFTTRAIVIENHTTKQVSQWY